MLDSLRYLSISLIIRSFNKGRIHMNFGVIGYGYWGPNIVRNFAGLEGSKVLAIADLDPNARKRAQKAYRQSR